jgi:uncharacterized membrane protein
VLGSLLVTIGAVVVVIGSAMPWLRTGQRRRSSFEVFGLVDRLGFSPSGPIGWAVRLWPIVPLLVVLAAALAWLAGSWSLPVALVAVLYAGGTGVAVANVDGQNLIGIEDGPLVTALGASLLLLGAVVTAFATLRRRDHSRRSDPDPHRPRRHVRDR